MTEATKYEYSSGLTVEGYFNVKLMFVLQWCKFSFDFA